MALDFKLYPKQALAFSSFATEILYGGAAGPGKSHLLRVAFIVWCTELADMGLVNITELDIKFKNGPQGDFQGGSRISLNHCQYDADALNYKTIEFNVLGLEEATEFTPFQIRFLRSRVRMPDVLKIPEKYRIPEEYWKKPGTPEYSFPRILLPTNPGGPGHGYLKGAFIDGHEPLSIFRAPEDDGGALRQFIPAKLTDNPSVKPDEYASRLKGIGSEHYTRALLDGDWSVVIGSFFSELREDVHRIPNIIPPPHWFKFCWYDWGFSSPAACTWWTISDGEWCACMDGTGVRIPRGALVMYREFYICDPLKPAEGAQMDNRTQARKILERTGSENIAVYLADGKPFQSDGRSLASSPATEFLSEGIRLVRGNQSRVQGWSLMHSRLLAKPSLMYFCEQCEHTWRTLAQLQSDITDPEDCDSDGEDHLADCCRGACTLREVIKDRVGPTEDQIERVQQDWKARPTLAKILEHKGDLRGLFS
jgi:hypothetical protein